MTRLVCLLALIVVVFGLLVVTDEHTARHASGPVSALFFGCYLLMHSPWRPHR